MYVKLNSRFNAAPMLGRGNLATSKRTSPPRTALRVILLGPPGSGKGTQASRICSRYKLVHVSTGDILRRNTQEGTELGLLAKSCMESGKLVPDSIICDMMKELYLKTGGDDQSFVLDGFPRSESQAQELSDFLGSRGQRVHKVIMLELDDEEIVGRLTHRRTCPKCGTSYHLTACPPKAPGICDHDGAKLSWRSDDHEEVIRQRLHTYHEQTKPVADYYEKLGVLSRISANADMGTVEARISAELDDLVASL